MLGLIRRNCAFNFTRLICQRNGIARTFSNASNDEVQAEVMKETSQPNIDTKTDKGNTTEQISFAKLLRYSPFVQMGDPNGRIVVGTIIETYGDDLYIDFGAKFHCVCKKPRHKSDAYTRGTKVKLRLIDLELASKFMGSDQGITLHEAEATLLGLYKEPSVKTQS